MRNPPEATEQGQSEFYSNTLKRLVRYFYEIWQNPENNVIEPDLDPVEKMFKQVVIEEIEELRRRYLEDAGI